MYFIVLSLLLLFFEKAAAETTLHNITIEGDSIARNGDKITAQGNVFITNDIYKITTNDMVYNYVNKDIEFPKGAKINDSEYDYFAKNIKLSIDDKKLSVKNASGTIKGKGYFVAKKIESADGKYVLEDVNASLCDLCDPNVWSIRAKKMSFDINEKNNGIKFNDTYFRLFNKTVFYLPYFSAPYPTKTGKTGFLLPKLEHRYGTNIRVPFYWKIKDNTDLTFSPSLGKRTFYTTELRHKSCNGKIKTKIETIDFPIYNKNQPTKLSVESNFINNNKNYEIGSMGNIVFGKNIYSLAQYNLQKNTISLGELYFHNKGENIYFSASILDYTNLLEQTKSSVLPQIEGHYIKPFWKNDLFRSNIKVDNFYDGDFSNSVNGIALNAGPTFKRKYGAVIVSYKPNLFLYRSKEIKFPSPSLSFYNVHDRSDNLVNEYVQPSANVQINLPLLVQSKIFQKPLTVEPYIGINVQPSQKNFINTALSTEIPNSIYTVNDDIGYFNGLNAGNNGSSLYYGLSINYYNIQYKNEKYNLDDKINILVAGQYNSIHEKKYIAQLSKQKNDTIIRNKSWFTANALQSNELSFFKKIKKVQIGGSYIFVNKNAIPDYFDKKDFYSNLLEGKLEYNINDKWSFSVDSAIHFSDSKIDHFGFERINLGITYINSCAKIGFNVKYYPKGLILRKANTSWQIFFDIPSLF